MSAFIVQDKTINTIVTWLAESQEASWYKDQIEKLGYDLSKPLSIEKLAKDMFFLNCKAVDARYGENEAEKMGGLGFRFRRACASSDYAVLKGLNCWHYQCLEGDEVPNHPLFKAMEKLASNLAQRLVSELPQYNACAWE